MVIYGGIYNRVKTDLQLEPRLY